MAEIRADPLAFLERLVAGYGDIVLHRVDDWNVVTLNRPEFVRQVLRGRERNYVKRGTPDEAMLTPLLGEGLLTSDGDVWKRQRRVAQPAFTHERIAGLASVVVEETLTTVERLRSTSGEIIRLDHELSSLTLSVVSRAIVGSETAEFGDRFGEMVDIANRFMSRYDGRSAEMIDAETLGFMKALMYLDEIVRSLVADRRRRGSAGDDLLGRWLTSGFDEREIRDQVVTMLMAGHETTAKALTWTLYLLAQHPEYDERLVAQVDDVLAGEQASAADLPRLPLVANAVAEALRLYPPVWLISRYAVNADNIGGYRVPAGSLVCTSPYLLHRNPSHWHEPDAFDPDRFDVEPTDFAYIPFGGGPRRCIGAHFALFEAQLVLATLRQRVDVRVLPDHPVLPEALVTLRPRFGLLATIACRA